MYSCERSQTSLDILLNLIVHSVTVDNYPFLHLGAFGILTCLINIHARRYWYMDTTRGSKLSQESLYVPQTLKRNIFQILNSPFASFGFGYIYILKLTNLNVDYGRATALIFDSWKVCIYTCIWVCVHRHWRRGVDDTVVCWPDVSHRMFCKHISKDRTAPVFVLMCASIRLLSFVLYNDLLNLKPFIYFPKIMQNGNLLHNI